MAELASWNSTGVVGVDTYQGHILVNNANGNIWERQVSGITNPEAQTLIDNADEFEPSSLANGTPPTAEFPNVAAGKEVLVLRDDGTLEQWTATGVGAFGATPDRTVSGESSPGLTHVTNEADRTAKIPAPTEGQRAKHASNGGLVSVFLGGAWSYEQPLEGYLATLPATPAAAAAAEIQDGQVVYAADTNSFYQYANVLGDLIPTISESAPPAAPPASAIETTGVRASYTPTAQTSQGEFEGIDSALADIQVETRDAITIFPSERTFLDARLVSPIKYINVFNPHIAVDDTAVHPSARRIPGGVQGYPYAMAYTPYPNVDAQLEDIVFVVSRNLVDWVALPGGDNPIAPQPAGTTYNADPELFFDPVDYSLNVVYRQRSATQNDLMLVTSEDGLTWTAPVSILNGAAGAGGQDFATPSLYEDGNGTYTLVTLNADAAPYVVEARTASSLAGPWSAPSVVEFNLPVGRQPWNISLLRMGDTRYVGAVQANDGTQGAAGEVYVVESSNGETYSSKLLMDGQYYKVYPLMLSSDTALLIGSFLTDGLFTQSLRFDGPEHERTRFSFSALADQGLLPYLVRDTFNRADDPDFIVNSVRASGPEAGSYALSSGEFDLTNNAAVGGTTGNNRVLYEAGEANYTATMDIAERGSQLWLWVRAVDFSNFIRIGTTSTTPSNYLIQVFEGGAQVRSYTTPLVVAPKSAERMEVLCKGANISIYVDGVPIFEFEEFAHLTTGTRAGIQTSGAIASSVNGFFMGDC